MKRILAFLLALISMLSVLSGCTTEPETETTETPVLTDPATEPITETTEPDTTYRIGGTPLAEFTVIYFEGYEATAKELAARLGAVCGSELSIKPASESTGNHEIVIGWDMWSATTAGYGFDDFGAVKSQNTDAILINGGSTYAIDTACARFAKLFTADKYHYDFSDITFTYTLPDRQEYINDLSKLALHWEFYHETPEWMLDFDEKYASYNTPDGRLMSCLHRGEMVYYPEDSAEGLISAVMLGADMVEIDPRVTKDGGFVLLHDATLTRTTDFAEKAGKNGLPEYPYLADWTYEQLMQLNLKMGQGGDGADGQRLIHRPGQGHVLLKGDAEIALAHGHQRVGRALGGLDDLYVQAGLGIVAAIQRHVHAGVVGVGDVVQYDGDVGGRFGQRAQGREGQHCGEQDADRLLHIRFLHFFFLYK